jgi:predicted esterase
MLAALALLACQDKLAPLPKSEAAKLGPLLTEALAEPGAKSMAKLDALAKTWSTKYEFASLVAALRAGPEYAKGDPKPRGKGKGAEKFHQFETVSSGFTFNVDKDEYRYCVDIPKSYDPTHAAPLLVDPGHGSGATENEQGKAGFLAFYRGQADAGGLGEALIARTEIIEQIGVGGLRGGKSDDEVAAVFDAFFRDLCSRFDVDLNRVFVAGLSQTGFWSWQLGNERADRFAGIAPMSAVSVQQEPYLPNFLALSIYVLHGDQDPTCPIAQPRKTCPLLEQLGVHIKFAEIAGAKHEVAVWSHLHEALAWLAEKPRDPYPKKIAKCVQTTKSPWCYWLRIDEIAKSGTGEAGSPATAKIGAEINGQDIAITSDGVERVTLCLSSELVDLSKPVNVNWNGASVHSGVVQRDFARCVQLAVEKVDWIGVFEAALELKARK